MPLCPFFVSYHSLKENKDKSYLCPKKPVRNVLILRNSSQADVFPSCHWSSGWQCVLSTDGVAQILSPLPPNPLLLEPQDLLSLLLLFFFFFNFFLLLLSIPHKLVS